MGRRPHRSAGQRTLLSVNIVAIAAALLLASGLYFGETRAERLVRVQLSGSLTEVERDESGDRVLNILLVGSDSSAGLDPDDPVAVGRVGEQNSDVMIIAHLDERDGTVALLSLPRDLWVEISATGRNAKLNSAFAIGGPAELIDTIELNFGIPINFYVDVDFAGFRGLVEAVGSVDVAFPQPARDWNAQHNRTQTGFQQLEAGCIALGPEEALAYVRSRHYQTMDADGVWHTDPGGDLGRIRRQQDFLKRLIRKAIDRGARNPFVLNDLIDSTLESVTVDQDLTPQLLVDLGRRYSTFEPEELQTYSYPGFISTEGALSIVRGMDTEAAPLLALFSGAPVDDPSTVLVRVKTDAATRDLALEATDGLIELGFDPSQPQTIEAPPGIEVRYGPDGLGAARVVVAAIVDNPGLVRLGLTESALTLVPTDSLTGREVIISFGAQPEVDPAESTTTTTTDEATDTTGTLVTEVTESEQTAVDLCR
ncbi:MAG: LCP family protein [Acidimicrobiales bacterium]